MTTSSVPTFKTHVADSTQLEDLVLGGIVPESASTIRISSNIAKHPWCQSYEYVFPRVDVAVIIDIDFDI